MKIRDSSVKTITNFLIKVFGRSQHVEIIKPQNDVESISFFGSLCWKAQISEVNTLPSGFRKVPMQENFSHGF